MRPMFNGALRRAAARRWFAKRAGSGKRPKGYPTRERWRCGLAPVPSFPIPTAADQLPVAKMKLPPGFKAEVWASGILDARGMRQGDKGTVFVSSLFVAGKIYAITDKGGKREVKTIAEKLFLPNGIEFYKGSLYVATPKDITRYDNIEDKLDNPPKPVMVYDKLPGDVPHGWKFIKIGPDGKLYVPVGAPCNICEPRRQARADLPHEPRRHRHGVGRQGRAQHGRLRLGSEDRRPLVHEQRPRLAVRRPAERQA